MGQNWIGVTCGKAEGYVVEIEGLCGKKQEENMKSMIIF